MKKTLSLLLALAMLMSLTAALAGEKPAAPDPKSILDGVELKPSENLWFEKPLEITGMGVHFNNYATEFDGCYFFPAIHKMTNAKVLIDWRVRDGFATQVATTLASKKLPDIIGAEGYGIMKLADEGAIIPLDEYLDLIPNVIAAVGENRMMDWRQADGHIYTLPTVVDVPGSQSLMIRKDWLDKLNLKTPENWEEWLTVWRAFRDNDMNGNGDKTDEIPLALEMGATGERCLASLLNAFGIRTSADTQFCLLDDGTYTMVYEHPRYPEFLQAVQDMYKEGLLDPEFTMRKQAELFTAMDANLVGTAMTWAERARISTYALRDSGAPDAMWACIAPIKGPHGDQMTQERKAVTSVWCLTSAAKEAGKVEDILRLFNWHYSDEGLQLYNFGIEGKTFDKVDGKCIVKPEFLTNGFVDYRATGMEFEPFGGHWLTEVFTQCLLKGETLDKVDDATLSFYNGLAVVNNDFFYAMPPTLETEEYTDNRGDLITGGEGVCVLRDRCIAGQITVEEFMAKYRTLKDNGLQDVIDAGTRAFDKIMGK